MSCDSLVATPPSVHKMRLHFCYYRTQEGIFDYKRTVNDYVYGFGEYFREARVYAIEVRYYEVYTISYRVHRYACLQN